MLLIQRIEGYANAGLNYIQHKFDEERMSLEALWIFVNLLRELTMSKKED